MKKKISEESDNEFSVDEPEELQGSDDDWTPEPGEEKRRSSRRLRNAGAKKPRLTEPSTSEEEEEDEEDSDSGKKVKGRKGKPAGGTPKQRGRPGKKPQITPVPTGKLKAKPTPDNIVSCEATSTTGVAAMAAAAAVPTEKEFTSGAFVVSKTDMLNPEGDPPIWKIDGKALLQKYVPFQQDGKTLYKNTSTYSGWSANNRDLYYPAPIVFKMQNRKETIVEFLKDKVKVGEIKEKEKSSEDKEPQQAANEEAEEEDDEEDEEIDEEEDEEEEVEDVEDDDEEEEEDVGELAT